MRTHFGSWLRSWSPIAVAVVVVSSGTLATISGQAGQDAARPATQAAAVDGERFSATAVNMAAMSAGPVVTPISIVISRWSTDAEQDALVNALREEGPDALLSKLSAMPRAGSIASTGSVGLDIHFARRIPGPNNSERVILITDRRLTFWERQSGSQTVDYPFTLVELRVGADGKGEGKASTATKVIVEPESKTVVLENWATQPVALQNVMREK